MIQGLQKFNIRRKSICIICEGFEEYDYLQRLSVLNVYASQIYKITLINANSNGNLAARYQDLYARDAYDLVVIFCDTDTAPYKEYKLLKDKINKIHGNEGAANKVIFFANPCTLQIVLLHFDDIKLKSSNKHKNSTLIYDLTQIRDYRANKEQRSQLMDMINKDNFRDMLERVAELSTDEFAIGSSNFYTLMHNLRSKSTKWIDKINKKL
jgi:hypothetical protein